MNKSFFFAFIISLLSIIPEVSAMRPSIGRQNPKKQRRKANAEIPLELKKHQRKKHEDAFKNWSEESWLMQAFANQCEYCIQYVLERFKNKSQCCRFLKKVPNTENMNRSLALQGYQRGYNDSFMRAIFEEYPELVNERFNYNDASTTTHLHEAIKMDDVAGTKYLLEKGANPNILNGHGQSLLFSTNIWRHSIKKQCAIVKLLVSHGADVHSMRLGAVRCLACLELFLAHGCCVDVDENPLKIVIERASQDRLNSDKKPHILKMILVSVPLKHYPWLHTSSSEENSLFKKAKAFVPSWLYAKPSMRTERIFVLDLVVKKFQENGFAFDLISTILSYWDDKDICSSRILPRLANHISEKQALCMAIHMPIPVIQACANQIERPDRKTVFLKQMVLALVKRRANIIENWCEQEVVVNGARRIVGDILGRELIDESDSEEALYKENIGREMSLIVMRIVSYYEWMLGL